MLRTSVGILIFHDVEVLDFAGPFEVFSRTRLTPGVDSRRSDDSAPFKVFTVARSPEPVVATGGLRVEPHFAFDSCPPIDVLVVPGGFGTRPLLEDPACSSGFAPPRPVGVDDDVGVHGGAAAGPGRAAARRAGRRRTGARSTCWPRSIQP